MNFRSPQLWIAFFSLIVVFTMALVDIERTSPGPLATAHQRDPELAAHNACAACHGGWGQAMSQACLDCHEVIEYQIEEAEGLHGTLGGAEALACGKCHSDHHGAAFSMVSDLSFRLAGVPDVDAFDHGMIGFPMDGAHLEVGCDECHKEANQAIIPPGKTRYIGLDKNCSSCHADPHEGDMGNSCAQCHSQSSFEELAYFDHERILFLTGGHGEVSCRDCHAQDTPHALESLGRGSSQRDCADCHESPHSTPFVDAVSQLEGKRAGASCESCHVAEHATFRDALETTPEQHAVSGFALRAPHADVACDQCHGSDSEDFQVRFPGRRARDCASCHEDPHDGQFDTEPYSSKGCIACHDTRRFDPHEFGVELHSATAFPLTGSHLDNNCGECHTTFLANGVRNFEGMARNCGSCHADAHRGFFGTEAEDCSTCHSTDHFFASDPEHFDHARWTGFPILGAHAQSDCESCHKRSPEPNDEGRSLGFVADHFGEYQDCSTCHQSPHGDAFSHPNLPNEVDGRTSCARCHVESSFRSFPDGFDHGRWTGWNLSGEHARVACSACHEVSPKFDGEFSWGPAAGRNCASCHTDPHMGQFRQAGRTDCERCHNSTLTFFDLSFDHNVDSRFPLDAGHAAQVCSACHKPWPLASGGEVVRYRPLDTDCAACHGVEESELRKSSGGSR